MTPDPETARVVDALYEAYLAGDSAGMLALMADDVEVTFLGQGTFHGLDEVRRFMAFSAGLLRDMAFTVHRIIIDGDVGCAVWSETATTRDGRPWATHGVDVIRVRDGRIASLHENNDVRMVHAHLPRYGEAPA